MPCSTLIPARQLSVERNSSQKGENKEEGVSEGDVLGVVNPKKVGVENGLERAGEPGDLVNVSLCEIPVQPIGYI